MKLENIKRLTKRVKEPKLGKMSVGGTLGQFGIFELIQFNGNRCYAVLKKDQVQFLNEVETEEYLHKPIKKVPWKLPSTPKDYVESTLYEEMRTCIKQHLDHSDERTYDILTAWVMATYQLERWMSVPYLFFFGPFETGKTRALEILSALSFRGWLGLGLTPANLYRPLELFHPTLFLDEAQIYGDKEEFLAILNGSYRRGQLVPRQIETAGGYTTEFYDCFSFKALAGTRDLAKTLASRCIIFKMSKATRKVNLFVDEEWTRKLRSQLLTYRFHKICGVDNVEDEESGEGERDILERAQALAEKIDSGRLTELFYPLVETASTDQLKHLLTDYSIELRGIREEELALTDEVTVLGAILEAYKRGNVIKGILSINVIAKTINEPLPINEQWTNRHVAGVCWRLGFQKTRTKEGTALYWNRTLIERLLKDRRYKTVFEGFTFESPLLPPSPEPTSSALSTPKCEEHNENWIKKRLKHNE